MSIKFTGLIISILIIATILLINNKNIKPELANTTGVVANEVEELIEPKVISPISIDYLRLIEFEDQDIVIEEELPAGSNYKRYIASYTSDDNKIYGLLTIPNEKPPEEGYRAIVFNHGYIPPAQYKTTEKYVAYVDYLARNGFVVFKIDMRGHGDSEGIATGTYFSPGYTIDAINAVKALQSMNEVNPEKIGMWGHSMSGNLTLRAMEVSDEIKAGVIWAGAVYSYEDFSKYRLNDSSYVGRRRNNEEEERTNTDNRLDESRVNQLRESAKDIDFNDPFWTSVSLTKNLQYLSGPVQLHHAENDSVVNIGYSRDLAEAFKENNIKYELYEYPGGGHNINDPYFSTAMQRTVEFFNENL